MSLINIAKVIRTAIMAKDVRENIAKGFEEANSSISEVDGKIGNKDDELDNWMDSRESELNNWKSEQDKQIAENDSKNKELIYDNTLVLKEVKVFSASEDTTPEVLDFNSDEITTDCDAIEVVNNGGNFKVNVKNGYTILATIGPGQTKRVILTGIEKYKINATSIFPDESSLDITKATFNKYSSLADAIKSVEKKADAVTGEVENAHKNNWAVFANLKDRLESDWKKTPILACVHNMSIPAEQGSNYATFKNGYHDISGYTITDGKIKLKKNCYYKISIQFKFTMKSSTIDTTTTSMFLAVLNKDGNRVNYITMYNLTRYNSSEMSGSITFDYVFDTTGIDSDDVALELNVITNSQQVESFSDAKLTLIRLAEA